MIPVFTNINTFNKDKEYVYEIILDLIKNDTSSLRYILDMPWLNFELIDKLLLLDKNLIIYAFEQQLNVFENQQKIQQWYDIPKNKLKLQLGNVADEIYNHRQRKYLVSFLDFCGEMCNSMSTSLTYINSKYVVLTVKLSREKGYWKSLLDKEDRYTTHTREFERAGLAEFKPYYEYTSHNPNSNARMRIYFLKKV